MDRAMFPRTVVRIELVEHLLDLGRQDLLAAVMGFCSRQSRSRFPCKDLATMQAWCRVTANWWTVHGAEVIGLIPPLGGGSWGYPEIESAWQTHLKFAEKGKLAGEISGVRRRLKATRRKNGANRTPGSTPGSTQVEAVQLQPTARPPVSSPPSLAGGSSSSRADAGGTPEPVPPARPGFPLPQPRASVSRSMSTHCPGCWVTCETWVPERPGSVPYCGKCGCDHVVGPRPAGMHPDVKTALGAQDRMERELARLRANAPNIVAVAAAAAAEPTPIRALPTTPKAASMLGKRAKTAGLRTPAKVAAKVKKRTA